MDAQSSNKMQRLVSPAMLTLYPHKTIAAQVTFCMVASLNLSQHQRFVQGMLNRDGTNNSTLITWQNACEPALLADSKTNAKWRLICMCTFNLICIDWPFFNAWHLGMSIEPKHTDDIFVDHISKKKINENCFLWFEVSFYDSEDIGRGNGLAFNIVIDVICISSELNWIIGNAN